MCRYVRSYAHFGHIGAAMRSRVDQEREQLLTVQCCELDTRFGAMRSNTSANAQ
jgi:hypothetical protein